MTYYVTRDENDPNKLAVIGAQGFIPSNVITECPIDQATGELEKVEWLNLSVDPESGKTIAVVDKVKKDQILKQIRQQERDQREALKAFREAKKALKQKIRDLKTNEVTDIQDIREAIKALAEAVEELVVE